MNYTGLRDEIKARMRLTDVVSQYTKLENAGKNLKGKSPFTNEKTASFYVNPQTDLYYCFSSNKGGDVFTFVQEIESVDFPTAVKKLAEMAHIDMSQYTHDSGEKENPQKSCMMHCTTSQRFTSIASTILSKSICIAVG